MPSVLRSFSGFLTAAVLLSAFSLPAQVLEEESIFARIGKESDRAASEMSFQVRDKLDFLAVPRTRAAIEKSQELRLLRASAAGKFVDGHFTGKIVVPVFFNCPDDPMEEQELRAFLDQAMSIKLAGPVYITPPDGALPLPDEQPTADQLNEALLRGIELRADVIVVFTGLPGGKKEKESLVFRQWSQNAPRLVFTEVPDPLFLKRSMFPCPVAAAIFPRPFPLEQESRPWYERLCFWKDAPPAPDPFDLHFVLLSDENADELVKDRTVFLSGDGK